MSPRIVVDSSKDESRVTVVFPNSLYAWLEAVAVKEDRPVANLVRYIVRRYLEEHYEADKITPPIKPFSS